jgi:rhodanese-related sulfurtransferase
MRKLKNSLVFFILIFSLLAAKAQYDPNKVCRIENGKIIFLLNLKWTEKEKKEVRELFDLDSALIARAYKGESNIKFEGEVWKATRIKQFTIELSKPFQSTPGSENPKKDDLILLIDKWMNFSGASADESVVYGINKFEIANTFIYDKNAWFYLAGNKTAEKVNISGTFNKWSTNQNPMKSVSTGWTAELNLKPGKYLYKFIVDGKWIQDPYNDLKEKDGAGGYNSVVYCPNHIFELKGFEQAKKVVVTGNFYKWNPRGLPMKKTATGWSLPIYLRDGTYAYKFLVDDRWIADPANKSNREDSDGNLNSFISIGEAYQFKLDGFANAKKIVLTGSFNGWSENELLMDRTNKGWQMDYVIPAGNYEYKFIVDGKWTIDPGNPFSNGSGNSENSFLALKANRLFELDNHADAKSVLVTGSFNGWDKNGYRMIKKGGKWIFPLFLKPGKYIYKFVVDGNWILDPANKLYEQNEYGTYNSVLWIDP